jgi:hypothetical protein
MAGIVGVLELAFVWKCEIVEPIEQRDVMSVPTIRVLRRVLQDDK